MAIIEKYEGVGFSVSHSFDTNPVDEHFKYHIHDRYELFCLVKGRVGYVVEGHTYKLRSGAILLMRQGEAHKLIVNESDEYERYVLIFRPEIFNAFSASLLKPFTDRGLGARNLYLSSELGVSAITMFEKIFKEAPVSSPLDAIVSNISALLSSIGLAFFNNSSERNNTENDLGHSIISYINENLSNDLSLETISRIIHLSPSQINRIFRKITGTSIHDYILSKRLILFQEKLSSGKSATIASQECGFNDYSSFYRLYKKRFGVSPTRIQK